MKPLIEMNLSPRWVSLLADRGIEGRHWSTVGPVSATDPEIMAYAASNEFVVLTHDLDFGAILAATHGEKPSVVQIKADDVRTEAIGDRVCSAIRQMQPELEASALLTIDLIRTRVNVLPLKPKR